MPTRRLLFVGRPSFEKGLSDLLAAVDTLDEFEIETTVIGADAAVVAHTFSLDAPRPHRYRLLGPLPNHAIPHELRRTELLIVPSRYETFGLIALEGMACGCCVVAARTGGLRSLVDHMQTGLHFTPGDVQSLAAAVRTALVDPGLAPRLARAAQKKSLQYGWDNLRSQFDRLFRAFASGSPPAPVKNRS